jgi:translation elongation factor EF-Tu-like GTPase
LFTLLKVGARTSPIGNNYRPQFRFPLAASEITCAVQLPAASPTLEPGQTANASLACGEEVRIERGKQEFTAFEGGKPVGSGLVQLP